MASDLIVPVVEVKNVRIHPNADMLSICEVLGYQMVNGLVEDPEGEIVRTFIKDERDERGRRVPVEDKFTSNRPTEDIRYSYRYKDGDKAVYFPADTILPQKWAEEFEVAHLLQGENHDRVGRCRLRGEPSFGLIVGLPEGVDWELGQNVADYYGAEKYVPTGATAPDAAPYDSEIDPHFVKYTDVQNGLLLYEHFQDGEGVVATEKIHGRNCRVGYVKGKLCVGSRTIRLDPEVGRDKSMFWPVAERPEVKSLLDAAKDMGCDVILFGEIYGPGVQSLHYGCKKEKGFRAFDVYVNGEFLNFHEFADLCDLHGVERTPVLYQGPFDLEKIKEVAEGKSVLPGASNIREGVVVRTTTERRDPAWGRMVMKFISSEYDLSKHKKKDTTDL